MKPVEILIKNLQDEGIELAEETARSVVKILLDSLGDMVVASENKFDDMLLPVIELARPQIMELVEDINKADNK